jgi:hypothetical protein
VAASIATMDSEDATILKPLNLSWWIRGSFSLDGRWVIYSSFGIGKNGIWKISIDGGEPVQIVDKDASQPVVSPAIIPFEGGAHQASWDTRRGWVVAKRRLAAGDPLDARQSRYRLHGHEERRLELWAQPIDGGRSKQLTNFTSGEIFWFDLSRDGKPSVFSRGAITKDVVLIANFRQWALAESWPEPKRQRRKARAAGNSM